MAQSALAAQLRKLRAPQTDVLREKKRRVSLLFDHREAAALDARTVHDIGVNGFNRLVEFDPAFEKFRRALYSDDTREFERAIQTKKVNDELNAVISEYLLRVSPYFLLSASHEALEWLIYRFRIHAYNESDFVACILPHHDSALFARALQVLEGVQDNSSDFFWLADYRRRGVPVPKIDLYRLCERNLDILEFVGKAAMKSAELKQRAGGSKVLLSLFVQCVAGVLEKKTSHGLVVKLLPFLLKGLQSKSEEFRTATHFVLAQLLVKAKLQDRFVGDILERFIQSVKSEPITPQAISILFMIVSGQNMESLPVSCAQSLVSSDKSAAAFGSALQAAQASPGVPALPLLHPIVKVLLAIEDEGVAERIGWVQKIMSEVDLRVHADEEEVEEFCGFLVSCMTRAMRIAKGKKVRKIARENSQRIWQGIETSYPTAYDKVFRNGLLSEKRGKAANNEVLELLQPKSELNDLSSEATQRVLFVRLNHPSSGVRAAAFTQLAAGISRLQEDPDSLEYPVFIREAIAVAVKSETDSRCLARLFQKIKPELMARLAPLGGLTELVKKCLAVETSSSSLIDENFGDDEKMAVEGGDKPENDAHLDANRILLVAALKVLGASGEFRLGNQLSILRRLVIFFIGCESSRLYREVASLDFVKECAVFSKLLEGEEKGEGIETRMSALVAGFATPEGLSLLQEVLQECLTLDVKFANSGRLHVLAAKLLFKLDLSGKVAATSDAVEVEVVAKICSFVVRFLANSKFTKPKVKLTPLPVGKFIDESAHGNDMSDLMSSFKKERCSWSCVVYLASSIVRGLRIIANRDSFAATLSSIPWWTSVGGGAQPVQVSFLGTYLQLLDFVVGKAVSYSKKDKNEEKEDEGMKGGMRAYDWLVLQVFDAMAIEKDWNIKALIAAWRGKIFGRFRPSPEFKIRAASLLPSVIASTTPLISDEVDLSRWLGSIVVSLLADKKLSSREAGYVLLDVIHPNEEGKTWQVTAPTWSFLFSALKSKEKEVIADPSELASVFSEAMKLAETLYGKARGAAKAKAVDPADILNEVKSLIVSGKTSDGKERIPPPLFVRMAAATLLLHCESEILLPAISPLVADLLSDAAGRSPNLDAGERSAKVTVFQAFVKAALTPVSSDSSAFDENPAENQLFGVIKQAILDVKPTFKVDGSLVSAEELMANELSKEYFSSLPQNYQENLLETLLILGDVVEGSSSRNVTKLVSAEEMSRKAAVAKRVRRTIRRVLSDGGLLAKHLRLPSEEAKALGVDETDAKVTKGGRKSRRGTNVGSVREKDPDILIDAPISTPDWRKYQLLLESFCASRKVEVQDAHVVVPMLCKRLQAILARKDNPTADYPCQLTLSFLHRCCELCQAAGDKSQLSESDFKIETVIRCIQEANSLNVKTHAFLLLGLASAMFPAHLLVNVMSIFTFMGESILRLDDAYAFEVIKKTISAIIPPLLEAHPEEDANRTIVQIVRVFVIAFPDIPPHRRLPLFQHILEHIKVHSYLWIVLGVFMEGGLSRIVDAEQSLALTGGVAGGRGPQLPWSLEYAIELAIQYSAVLQIYSCKALLSHCRKLPIGLPESPKEAEKSKNSKKGRKPQKDEKRPIEELIFDPETHSVSVLRQFQYSILCLISRILSSDGFSAKFLEIDEEERRTFRSITRDVVKEVVAYVEHVSRVLAAQKYSAASAALLPQDLHVMSEEQREEWEIHNFVRYGRVLLARATDVLDKVKEMLPIDFYFDTLVGIVENGRHEQLTLIKKVMDLIKTRLQDVRDVDKESLAPSVCARLLNFVPEFVNTMLDVWSKRKEDHCVHAAQNALFILKLLAQIAGARHPELFAEMPAFLASFIEKLVPMASDMSPLLGFSLLSVGAIVSILGADSIFALNQLLEPIVKILSNKKLINESELLCGSALTATQKVLEIHPRFVAGERLTNLIIAVARIPALPTYKDQPAESLVKTKLRTIKQAIATRIEPRVFCPAMLKAYQQACSEAARLLAPPPPASPHRSLKKRRKSKAVQESDDEDVIILDGSDSIETKSSNVVEFMSSVVEAHFGALHRKVVGASVREIESMFLEMFDYRRFVLSHLPKKAAGKEEITAELDQAEVCVIRAFLAPILKLSADGFRPVFYRLHHWSARAEDLHTESDKSGPYRLITFYRLCESLSSRLKDLFEPFAEHVFVEMVTILKKFIRVSPETERERADGTSKQGEEELPKPQESAIDEEFLGFVSNLPNSYRKPLLKATLRTLANCFAFCPPASFLSKERFDFVSRPLVDQLENTEMSDDDIAEFVVNAITKLGTGLATAGKESMWQTLSKLIMLKAAHKNSGVRLLAVNCEKKLIDALGRDAVATLTPDLLPSIGELMEDEDEVVEKEAHALLVQMEEILGERLQKYL